MAEQIRQEIEEVSKDLSAFMAARDLVRNRLREVRDQERALTPLADWSGTDAVLGSLDLAIHAMERTVEELRQIEKALEHGRKFRVVEGNERGSQD